MPAALSHIRICDFTGQLAGAAIAWKVGYDDHSLPPMRGGG